MKAFLVANPKGGSGKSTLSTNLAGYLAHTGASVMLGDVDQQWSARRWLATRPHHLPPIQTWETGSDRVARPPKGVSHAVLDTPAALDGKLLERVLKLSARVIVPVQPSAFDMWATQDFLNKLLSAKAVLKGKANVAVVGMRVDARTRAAADLDAFFATLDIPVLTHLRDTQLYVQAASAGMTLFDLPPSRTARDLQQWQPIIDWVQQG